MFGGRRCDIMGVGKLILCWENDRYLDEGADTYYFPHEKGDLLWKL